MNSDIRLHYTEDICDMPLIIDMLDQAAIAILGIQSKALKRGDMETGQDALNVIYMIDHIKRELA